jgi:outer membrane protein TolC
MLNSGRFEVGKIGENDLLKSELALLRARAAVDDAKLGRDRAEAALRRIISYPEAQPLSIVTPDSIPGSRCRSRGRVREAAKNSSTTEQARLDLVQTRRGISQAKSNNRFNASIQASAGFNQTASVFGDAYQSPLGKQTLTVGLNMPMLQWGAGHAGGRKRPRQRAARDREQQDPPRRARGGCSLLGAGAPTGAAQRHHFGEGRHRRAKQFEVARNRYIIGKISNTDLYTAQDQKDQAVLAKGAGAPRVLDGVLSSPPRHALRLRAQATDVGRAAAVVGRRLGMIHHLDTVRPLA